MTQMRELTKSGRRIVRETIQSGDRVTAIDDATLREHSAPIEELTADVDALRTELDAIVADTESYDTEIDVRAAEPVHEHLAFTRYEAANVGLWHWLATAVFPEFVYHRWPPDRSSDQVGKFLEGGTNIYSNAIHRLWWIAELTEEDGDYSRTERAFDQGELANDVFDRWFARYQPAARVIVDKLAQEPSSVISDTTRDIKNDLSNYKLELMESAEIEGVVDRMYKREE